jgi:SAM-dependent methyltransferase
VSIGTRSELEMIAYALEVDPQLLPLVPQLLAELNELGSDAELIVEVLADLGLPSSTRGIDLGCGKGTVAIEIATKLGFRVDGVDLFEPFIAIARERAAVAGVADLCTFQCADILKVVDAIEPADIATFAALGDVLGPLDQTIGVIRRFVRPGGYIIINDDYVKEGGSSAFASFEYCSSHEETLRRLQSCGDVLKREALEPPSNLASGIYESRLIRRRAELLAEQHAELKEALLAFAEDQAREYEYIANNLIPAVWVLERSRCDKD